MNFNRFAERKKSILINRIKQNIQNLLGDEELSKHIKERNYSLQKEIILKTLIQEFNGSDANVKPKIIKAINIGFLSCSGTIPRLKDKTFLSFIIEKLLSSEEYYDYGLMSLYFLLNDYSELDANLLLNQIKEDNRNLIYNFILRGLTEKAQIKIPNNILNEIKANVKKIYNISENLRYRNLFFKVFNDNKEILNIYLEPIEHLIDLNINRIFSDPDVLTIVKPIYVNFYSNNLPIFKKIDTYLNNNLDNPNYLPKIIEFVSYFKTEHWSHPFYKKFYRKFFSLAYKFKEKDDIHSIGLILDAFNYSSIIDFKKGKIIDEDFFLKLLKDLKFEYRTNKSQKLNKNYQFIESYLGLRPQPKPLRPKLQSFVKSSALKKKALNEFSSGFKECDYEINGQLREFKFFETSLTPNTQVWLEIIKEFFIILHNCYDYPYYFRIPAQKWKSEPKDMSPWVSTVLLHRFKERLKDKSGVSGGDSDHWIDEIPIEDKLLKTEENLNHKNILEEKYNKHKGQIFREAGKSGFGVLCIADIRGKIKSNTIAAFPLKKCFHVYYENNIWVAVFLIQSFTGTPSKVKSN